MHLCKFLLLTLGLCSSTTLGARHVSRDQIDHIKRKCAVADGTTEMASSSGLEEMLPRTKGVLRYYVRPPATSMFVGIWSLAIYVLLMIACHSLAVPYSEVAFQRDRLARTSQNRTSGTPPTTVLPSE